MVETRSIEMFIAIFAIVISIPILYASLPLINFTLTTQEPFVLDLPRTVGADTDWGFDGTNNNTRTEEILQTEEYTIGGSQAAWNLGTFNLTTADRQDNSGILGIGYANGTGSGPLRLFLRLDGTTGSVHDFSGRGNDGTVVNTPIRGATGTFSTNAFDFQRGDDDRIIVNNSASLNGFQNKITIEHWTYFDAVSQTRTLVRKDNAFRTFIATTGGQTSLMCAINGNTFNTGLAPTANEWHHITCTYDGNEVRVYLDGAIVGTFAFQGGNINNNGNDITIASNIGGANSFDGRIDEVRIHSRAFTEKDVNENGFFGPPTFVSEYTSRTIDTNRPRNWRNVTVNASIPTGTSADMDAILLFDNGTEDDRFSFALNDGIDTYVLPGTQDQTSDDFQLEFDGQSTRANASWEVNDALIKADLSLGASLVINNTSKSFSSATAEGIFASDTFTPPNVENPERDVSIFVENVTTSALVPKDTAINVTLQTSDDNFTTVEEEKTIQVSDGVDVIDAVGLNDTKHIRFDARLIIQKGTETPALERLKIFTTKTEQEQFPSEGFSLERAIILFVIAAFVFILFELLIHRER